MKLEPDKVYKVTKGNTDRSILTGDLVYIDGRDGSLVVPKGKAGLTKTNRHQKLWILSVYVYERKIYK